VKQLPLLQDATLQSYNLKTYHVSGTRMGAEYTPENLAIEA
jgi:hypothetical protein